MKLRCVDPKQPQADVAATQAVAVNDVGGWVGTACIGMACPDIINFRGVPKDSI